MSESFTFTVKFERRDDGGLFVWSPDVPLLSLSSDKPEVVMENLVPALEIILAEQLGVEKVRVVPAPPLSLSKRLEKKVDPHMVPPNATYCVAA